MKHFIISAKAFLQTRNQKSIHDEQMMSNDINIRDLKVNYSEHSIFDKQKKIS